MVTGPTIPPVEETDTQRIARFNALLSLISTEATLIWSRYYALLTANTIVGVLLGAIASKTGTDFSRERAAILLLVGLFGLILSLLWLGLTSHGWRLQHYWVAEAKEIPWPNAREPLGSYSQWCADSGCGEGAKDLIARYARGVIYLFIVGYVGAFLFAAYKLLCAA